jgi:hypothetical protein
VSVAGNDLKKIKNEWLFLFFVFFVLFVVELSFKNELQFYHEEQEEKLRWNMII